MKKLISISIVAIICFSFAGINVYSAEKKVGGSIFDYKKELSLTDKQEKDLKDTIAKLQSYLTDKQKELKSAQAELGKMVSESADLDSIKAKIHDITNIQADATYEDIAANRAVETELTGTQLSKWHGIQAEFARNAQQAQQAVSKTKETQK